MFRILVGAALLCLLTVSTAYAKRGPPPEIKPIEKDGVRFVVPNDDGRRAYVQAWDIKANKKLWEEDLFRTAIMPDLEEDVQWVFVQSMALKDGKLKFVNEKGRTFLLDLQTRKVVEEVK